MKMLRILPKRVLLYMFVSVALYSCKKGNTEAVTIDADELEKVAHTDMQYYDFDKIRDLHDFFDSIQAGHEIPLWSSGDDSSAVKELSDCIERINGFRKGSYKYYPDSLVKECIDLLGHECAISYNHGGCPDLSYAEWFLMMAAFYSPDITCLVHMQTPNHCAGIQNFGHTYNGGPWWSYVLLKRNKGYEVRRIGSDETRIEKIFQIEDGDNLYYLCSNNQLLEFIQILYWVKDPDTIVQVAQCDSLPAYPESDYDECFYNPNQRTWHCCNVDNKTGNRIPVTEKPSLALVLNKDKSYFIESQ